MDETSDPFLELLSFRVLIFIRSRYNRVDETIDFFLAFLSFHVLILISREM